MFTTPTLRIRAAVMRRILNHARHAGRNECMGLLARRLESKSAQVTACCLLPAVATGSHAEAAPLDIKQAAEQLLARGLKPAGIWHSHGNHAVFHSHTDDRTVDRFLPAMAEWNFQRPRPAWLVPMVTGPNRAVLPLPDGQALCFQLLGPEIPGLDAHEATAWSSVQVAFGRPCTQPRTVQRADRLRLEAGGVALTLGLPAAASLTSRLEDPAPFRTSVLFSLVVNNRDDAHAEALIVHDLDGHSLTHQMSCGIEIVGKKRARTVRALNDGEGNGAVKLPPVQTEERAS